MDYRVSRLKSLMVGLLPLTLYSKYVAPAIKPRTPRTNGMVWRFNGGVEEVLEQTRLESSRQLKETLTLYLRVYNHHIPQKNLGHITPVEALKKRSGTHPELFKKSVYNLSGLDNSVVPNVSHQKQSCSKNTIRSITADAACLNTMNTATSFPGRPARPCRISSHRSARLLRY